LQDIESKYPVDLINKIVRLTSYTGDSLEQKKEIVHSFAVGQSNYHHNRIISLEERNKGNSRIKTFCLLVFAGVLAYHAIYELSLAGLPHFSFKNLFEPTKEQPSYLFEFSVLLYLFIPATLARFEAVKYINDWERLITQSNYMKDFFAEIAIKSKSVNDDKELYSLLKELNDNMYLENLDWEMFMRNKNETIT
jgi:hypothetical protein